MKTMGVWMGTLQLALVVLCCSSCLAWTKLTVLTGANCPKKCICTPETGLVNCTKGFSPTIPEGIPDYVKTLDLSLNKLTNIPAGSFSHFSKLEVLNLAWNHLRNTSFNQHSFDGIHSLSMLDLTGNNLTSFPHHLPMNISYLHFPMNQMGKLDKNDLAGFKYLYHLDLSYNLIPAIPPGFFAAVAPGLMELDIAFNDFTAAGVPDGSFKMLTNLQLLNMSECKVNKVPQQLPVSLKTLVLVDIGINKLPKASFSTMKNLEHLAVYGNQMTEIEDHAFEGLSNVKFLDISSNKLEALSVNTFTGAPAVQTLMAAGNAIEKIEDGSLNVFQHPTDIWISGNHLRSLDTSFQGTFSNPSVSQLVVDFNPWVCDCHLAWLKTLQDKHPAIFAMPKYIFCDAPAKLKGMSWDKLTAANFTC